MGVISNGGVDERCGAASDRGSGSRASSSALGSIQLNLALPFGTALLGLSCFLSGLLLDLLHVLRARALRWRRHVVLGVRVA